MFVTKKNKFLLVLIVVQLILNTFQMSVHANPLREKKQKQKRSTISLNTIGTGIRTTSLLAQSAGFTAITSADRLSDIFETFALKLASYFRDNTDQYGTFRNNQTHVLTKLLSPTPNEQSLLKPNFTNLDEIIKSGSSNNTDSDNNLIKSRQKRQALASSPMIQTVQRVAAWTVGMLVLSAASSVIDKKIKESGADEQLAKITFDCNKNSFGCIQNHCWRLCGPRPKKTGNK